MSRFWNSAVSWAWGSNVLLLGSGLLLFPLLLRSLSTHDLGFHYLLISVLAVVPLVDFGLSVSIDRNVSYAMGGAEQIVAQGLQPVTAGDGKPNFALLWKLLHATRVFYRFLALFIFLALGIVGTCIVSPGAGGTSRPAVAWLAWGIALVNATFDIYFSWWNVFLRGMNCVVMSNRILFFGYAFKLVLSCALLRAECGLASIFAAGIISSVVMRWFSRRACLRLLPRVDASSPGRPEVLSILRALWPNSWRVGLQLFSSYLSALANSLICFHAYGLSANAQYGVSLHVASIVQGVASVWTGVKWPLVGQYRARGDHPALRRMLWPRIWLQILTFLALAALAFGGGPSLLRWMGTDKELLPALWFLLMMIHTFMETQTSFWTTLLSTENRVPSLWPIVATNAVNVLLVLLLIQRADFGLGVFVIVPICTGLLFNYWYWPRAGARNLHSDWIRFTFSRPRA